MAGEIQIAHGVTGRNLYAVIRSAVGTVWNGTTFVTYNGANWTTYAVALTEQGTSGYYVGTFPTVASGVYNLEVRDRLGGSPATTDTIIGAGFIEWSGSSVVALSSRQPLGSVALDDNGGDVLSQLITPQTVTEPVTGPTVDLSASFPATAKVRTQIGGLQGDTVVIFTLEESTDGVSWNTHPATIPLGNVVGIWDTHIAVTKRYLRLSVAVAGSDPMADLTASVAGYDGIPSTVYKLDTAMVLDGAVYQFTANALELSPAVSDWTTDEKTAIRSILGIPLSGITPEDPVIGIMDTIRDGVVAMPTSVWTHPTRTLTSVAPVPPPPSPFSSADMVINIKQALQQTMMSILVATASPKPSYTIEGQTVNYGDFIKMLIDSIKQLNELWLMYDPYELKSVIDG